jgi:aspartokinase/homoserine dehydrogenase 1
MAVSQKSSSKTLVMKFGGTSVGSPEAMSNAARIVRQARTDWTRLVVVTSALSGVTDLLLDSAARAVEGDQLHVSQAETSLQSRHEAIVEALITDLDQRQQVMQEIGQLIDSFGDTCRAVAVLGEATLRARDAIASLGERMAVRLLAAALESAGVPAQYVEASQLVVTDAHFQSAHPDFEATTQAARKILLPLLDEGVVPVVTGFLGATLEGVITTLGRGGSDYTAAILGAVLPADDVWIWTDVSGVMTADPRLVDQAQTIPELSYREIAELAYFGAKVLHPKAIRPVVEAGIGLRICNTFEPEQPGTRLIADSATNNGNHYNGNSVIKAVTAIQGQRLITIDGRGMLGVPGVAARTFGAVASTDTSVPLITQASSEQSICFAVPSEAAPAVVSALEDTFAAELSHRDIDRIWTTEEVSIITAVGAGVKHTPGVAGQVFSQLGSCSVNVLAIAHGSSDVSISLVVDMADTEKAVKALHELIVKKAAKVH